MKTIVLLVLIILTWSINTFHIGVLQINHNFNNEVTDNAKWFSKEQHKINHIFLEGRPYNRGYQLGKITSNLLYKQEKQLTDSLKLFFSNRFTQSLFVITLIRWFWGIDKYLYKNHLEEMLGVSVHTSSKFDYLADKFTRQIAYHGLHEVGQFFVDHRHEDLGCTVFGIKNDQEDSWLIGRNFDFEAGRIFDEEKIIKWVIPEQGIPFVSVIWAGMVGSVTGVNLKGIYASINAAGSGDFVRFGNPSTLILTKILQEANTLFEAIEILKNEQMFITDIFVLANGYRTIVVEKSPKKISITDRKQNFVVTNHLQDKIWKDDKMNNDRMRKLTTIKRYNRGKYLLENKKINSTSDLLELLRDKSSIDNKVLNLSNRKAIDSLIATHSVIYDSKKMILWISKGPAISGPFIGYDIKKSFQTKSPIEFSTLNEDPIVTRQLFYDIKNSLKYVEKAKNAISENNCQEAKSNLIAAKKLYSESVIYYTQNGNYHELCTKNLIKAKENWRYALELGPAYLDESKMLLEKLK